MKTIVPVRKRNGLILPALAVISMLTVLTASANDGRIASSPSSTFSDTILVQKQSTSKKIKVKLYPNANHEVLFFSASGEDGKVFQLFLFDLDGKLVKQVNIRNKQTTVLNRIEKGNYLFEVFSDDERIETGQVIVK